MTTPRTVIVADVWGLGAGIVAAYLAAGDRVATCARSATPEVKGWTEDPHTADRFLFVEADLAERDDCAQPGQGHLGAMGHDRRARGRRRRCTRRCSCALLHQDADAVINLNDASRSPNLVTDGCSLRSGSIVNISSIVGLSGYRGLSVYAATKPGARRIHPCHGSPNSGLRESR